MIEEIEITEDEIHEEFDALALRMGLSSAEELFARLDRGEWAGTILAARVHMLCFMLGEDV